MGIKQIKPTNPASRQQTRSDFAEITTDKPYKALTEGKPATGARNSRGHITTRFRGGGHKRRYRLIDFRRDKHGVPATVVSVEYDPNRSARIALLQYADGERRYILWPVGLEVGAQVMAGEDAPVNAGNALPLRKVPLGSEIHNIELRPGKGGQIVRSAGTVAQLMARDGSYAQVRLPSGEVRKVHVECYATVGQVGNIEHENISWGKAGRIRYLGFRPHNRGVVMNPVDHPMGGGEGKTSGGRHPVSPWGQPAKGYKTRRNKRTTSMIVRRRK
jgi:large subunit ribosomal protein L2